MRQADGPALEWAILSDGTFALDGGAMFGVVPRALWGQALPPDADNRVRLGLNCLLVRRGGRTVLVDTGVGDKGDEAFRTRHAVERQGGLTAALAARGIGPEEVTDVINSHLHWDHAGGNTRPGEGGRPVATFPGATYYSQRGEVAFARARHPRTRGSYRPEDFEPLLEEGRMVLVDGEAEIAPGIRVHPAAGHLPHMQVVTVEAGDRTLLFAADLIPTTHHLAPAWVMGFDVEPLTTAEVKGRWLARAAAEGWSVIFYHDAQRPLGRVAEKRGRWVVRPEEGD